MKDGEWFNTWFEDVEARIEWPSHVDDDTTLDNVEDVGIRVGNDEVGLVGSWGSPLGDQQHL